MRSHICPLQLEVATKDVPTGELPRNVLLSVDRNLVQTIIPGTRLTVLGIFSVFQASATQNQKGAVGVKQPYIRLVRLEQAREANSTGPSSFTLYEELEFKEFAQKPDAYFRICSMIAPSIYDHADVKKALACLLFGGSRKRLTDGVRLRDDIHILLLGDPSTAKSQVRSLALVGYFSDLSINKSLSRAKFAAQNGHIACHELKDVAIQTITEAAGRIDYVEIVDQQTLKEVVNITRQ